VRDFVLGIDDVPAGHKSIHGAGQASRQPDSGGTPWPAGGGVGIEVVDFCVDGDTGGAGERVATVRGGTVLGLVRADSTAKREGETRQGTPVHRDRLHQLY